MVPKSTQNQSKINEKSISDASLFSSLFFNRFFIIFSFLDEAPEPWKSLKTYWFFNIFILSAVSISCYMYIQILIKFRLILASKIDQKSLPKPSKIDIEILIDFLFKKYRFWLPKSTQNWPKIRPREWCNALGWRPWGLKKSIWSFFLKK